MGEPQFIGLLREAVWTGTMIAAPVLVAILVVFRLSLSFMSQGLVSLFQTRIIPLVAEG